MRSFLLGIIFICAYVNVAAQNFFKTPSGARYHLSNCSTVKNVSKEITAAEARALGLTPCLRCHPEDIYSISAPLIHKAKGEGQGLRCLGTTKAGNRCRHMTKIGNQYCFQHQP